MADIVILKGGSQTWFGYFGYGSPLFGQSFVATGEQLGTLSFRVDVELQPEDARLRAHIVTVDPDGTAGDILYTSDVKTVAYTPGEDLDNYSDNGEWKSIDIDLSNTLTQPGSRYGIIWEFVSANDGDPDSSLVFEVHTYGPYTDGSLNYSGGTVADHQFWESGYDVALVLTFEQPAPVDRPPAANADTGTIGENDPKTVFDVLANDSDLEGGALTLSTLGAVSFSYSNGDQFTLPSGVPSLASIANNKLELTPGTLFDPLRAGEYADVAVAYTVADPGGLTASSTLMVRVNGQNDAIAAVDDTWAPVIGEDTEVVISTAALLGNDTDLDAGDTKSLVSVSATSGKGSAVSIDTATGEVVYVASASSFDSLGTGNQTTDTFTYLVKDGAGATSTGTVMVTVQGAADGGNVYGTVNPDTLTGNATNQQFEANNGNDVVRAGAGIDRLMGQNGDDQLFGEDGNDFLWGDRGNDLLDGGRHNDEYNGGLGSDIFQFGAASGNDVIKDFKVGNDGIRLIEGVTLAGAVVSGANTTLTLSNGGTVLVQNVSSVGDWSTLLV